MAKGTAVVCFLLLHVNVSWSQGLRSQTRLATAQNSYTSLELSGARNWNNPERASCETEDFTQAFMAASTISRHLQAVNWHFDIPQGAIVQSIRMNVTRKALTLAVVDGAIALLKNGYTFHGDPIITTPGFTQPWPSTSELWVEASYPISDSADPLWGTTWTPQEINGYSFGISFQVKKGTGGTLGGPVDVQCISVTVEYFECLNDCSYPNGTCNETLALEGGDQSGCTCQAGFEGDDCSIEVIPTSSSPTSEPGCSPPCRNGGTCDHTRSVCDCRGTLYGGPICSDYIGYHQMSADRIDAGKVADSSASAVTALAAGLIVLLGCTALVVFTFIKRKPQTTEE